MANIGNLDFKVILDDKEFNNKIKADLKAAETFNTELSKLLDIKKAMSSADVSNAKNSARILVEQAKAQEKLTRETQKTAAAQSILNEKVARESDKTRTQAIANQEKLTREMLKTVAAQQRLNDSMSGQSSLLKELGTLATGYLSVRGAGQLLSSLTRITGEFELQRTTLRSILGDVEKADQIVSQIKELAVISPFEFKDLTTYAKQLSAYSFAADEIFETTKMLADVSAGLGVGMDRIILAYGQVKSAEFLRGQEVRQFTEAGIPILEELGRQFTEIEGRAVSAGEVFDKISKRLVPFEMVAKVFKDITSEGGKFYQMQEIQAETLTGKISNLKDAYEIMLSEIGEAHSDTLKGGLDMLGRLMENWERIGKQLLYIIEVFGFYKTAMGLLGISDAIVKFGGLSRAIKSTTIAQKALNSVLSANPYVLLATAITGVALALRNAYNESTAFRREITAMSDKKFSEADKLVETFKELSAELSNATEGSQKYRDAISRMNRQYGDYLPHLLTEKDALEQLKASSDDVTRSIYNRAKAYAAEAAQRKIEETYGEVRDNYAQIFLEKLQEKGIGRDAARNLMANFNKALKEQSGTYSPKDVFNQVYKQYFNTDEEFFSGFQDWMNDAKQNTLFIRNIYGKNATGWQTARDALWNYCLVLDEVNKAEKQYNDILGSRYGEQYSLESERKGMEEIDADYELWKKEIEDAALSLGDFDKAMLKLDVRKLEKMVSLYESLGRQDKVNSLREQLEALTKVQDGWKGDVNTFLEGMGLGKKSSYGLWTDDYTQALEYVNNLAKRHKEIVEEIQKTSSFDPVGAEALEKEKKAVEGIAEILKVDLSELSEKEKKANDNSRDNFLKAQIRILKNDANVIKEASKAYDDLMKSGFFTDDMAREFLAKIYGETAAAKKGAEMWSDTFEDFLKVHEGLRLDAYKDTGGVWTIGYGHTEDVKEGDKITVEQAEEMLRQDLAVRSQQINKILREAALELTQNQYDSLLDFGYNAGVGALQKLIKENKSIEDIGAALLTSNTKDRQGQTQAGLIKRRMEEYVMFMKDMGLATDENGRLQVDFEEKIKSVTKQLRLLGPEGVKAAEQVEASFDKLLRKGTIDEINDKLKEIFKSLEKYYQKMSEWSGKDFNLGGKGVDFDIRKIAADYATELDKIERHAEKMKNLLREIESAKGDEEVLDSIRTKFESEYGLGIWDRFWEDYVKNGKSAIDRISKAEGAAAKATAEDKLLSLAAAKVKELTKGLDMTDWGNKSLGQIKQIKQELLKLLSGDISLTDSGTEEKLNEFGISLDDLENAIKKILAGQFKNTTVEEFKKLQKNASKTMSLVGELGGILSSLGEGFDSDTLRGFSKTLSVVEEFANILFECDFLWESMAGKGIEKMEELSGATEGATKGTEGVVEGMQEIGKSSDWITMIIKVVMMAFTSIANGLSDSTKALHEAKMDAIEYAHALDEINLERALASHDTIFGSSDVGKLKEAVKTAAEYQKKMTELHANLGTTEDWKKNFLSLADDRFKNGRKLIERIEQVGFDEIVVDERSGWQKFWSTGTDMIRTVSISDFLDEDGFLDGEKLKAWYDVYGEKISNENKEVVEELIGQWELYEKAMEEVTSYISSLFDSLASDIADNMIDTFLEVGNATERLETVFHGLGRTILKSFLQSLVIEQILAKYEDKMKSLMIDYSAGMSEEKFADILGQMTGEMKSELENREEFWTRIMKAFQDNGLLESGSGDSSSNLSDGIKGITENTADLLASYLNAIRADVSFSKSIWLEMNLNVKMIASMLRPLPTIVDYLAKIQANTYDSSQNTGMILSEIRNVVSSEGGGSVRVLMS